MRAPPRGPLPPSRTWPARPAAPPQGPEASSASEAPGAAEAPPAAEAQSPQAPKLPPQPQAQHQLIAPTGDVSVDVMADVVNATAAPFMNAPPAHQGAVGVIASGVMGALGVINAPFQLLDTGLALLSSKLLPSIPLPAATIPTALHVGLPHGHGHPPSLIPPAPPIPLPSIGVVMLSGCVSVLISGLPAARAGDMGIAITCGSLAPPFEVYTGSSSVFVGGARAARMLDLTKHCNPASMTTFNKVMGVAGIAAGVLTAVTKGMDSAAASAEAEAAASQAEAQAAAANAAGMALGAGMAAAQAAADAAALAMSILMGKDPGLPPGMGALVNGMPNVLIGGFPMPPSLDVLKGLMRAVKGLAKGVRGGRKSGKLFCLRCG